MDFTIETYNKLLGILQNKGFVFQSFAGFIQNQGEKVIILRHDVDKLPENSLTIARLESSLGVRGSYFFRSVPSGHNEEIIRNVAELGHEIGYHYETMDTVSKKIKDKSKKIKVKDYDLLIDAAYEEFCRNLEMLRKIVPIETVCMHGSPLSKYDNRAIWGKYDYKKSGIIAEPYIDIDFNQVFYITDTGRMWDGDNVTIRDKPLHRITTQWPTYHSTFDIIKALNEDTFPNITMMTFHPQRWSDKPIPWMTELVWQNLKNVGKYFLVKLREKE